MPNMDDRRNEWFVPTIGPIKLRIFIGLLFLPYTGMVLAFTIIGATLADVFYPDRAGMARPPSYISEHRRSRFRHLSILCDAGPLQRRSRSPRHPCRASV